MADVINESVPITQLDEAVSLDGLYIPAAKAGHTYKVPLRRVYVPHVIISEAEYEALETKDPNTIYLTYEE